MKLYTCRLCGQDCYTFVQPALLVGRRRSIQIHCTNPACKNYLLTTDERDTVLIDERFIVEDDDSQDDDFALDVLAWRVESLQRIGSKS